MRNNVPLALKTRLRLLPLILPALFLLTTSSTSAIAADKKVLFLYADKSNGVMMAYRESLQSAMKAESPDRITFYEEYVDLSQYPGEDYVSLVRGFYRKKYQGQKFDLIFAQAPSVLNFLSKYGEEIFPGTPTVFGTLDQSRLAEIKLGPNITGVTTDIEPGKTLEAALRMQPDVQNVIVVSGTSPIDAKYLAQAQSQFRSFEGRVQFTYLSDLPIEALEKRLSELPENTITFYVTLFRDGAGQSFSLMDSVARVARASSVPTYSFVGHFLEVGSVGGFVFDNERDAKEVAKVALRLLAGEKPADIPVHLGDSNHYMFNWRELRRWRIDERRLPTGSVVLYRVPTFWEIYKWRVVTLTVFLLLLVLLILWLLITRKRIQRGRQAVQHLSARLLMLQEEERQRVAAELHDGLGQSLAIIKNRAIIGLRDQTDNQRAREQLAEIAATATASMAEVHEIAHNLRPYELDRLGLVGIAERVRVLGGSLAVESQPSRGTAINVSLELANRAAE